MLIAADFWPDWLVQLVRAVKDALGWFSEHRFLGVPLDWPLRAAILGGLYVLLRRHWRRRRALWACIALLVAKELFDVFATRHFTHPPLPDAGDVADIASGLAGILLAEIGLLIFARRGTRLH